MIDVLILLFNVIAVVAVALVFSGAIALGIGTLLAERSRCYRLPYEQPSHVRLLREDEP